MKSISASLVVFLSLVLLPLCIHAKLEFDSSQLVVKSSETVKQLVFQKIKRAQEIQSKQQDDEEGIAVDPAAVRELQDALRLVLARPDQDGTRNNMVTRLRRELGDLNSFDTVIKEIADEGIAGLKSSDTVPKHQATYIVILENLMAEIKPDLSINPEFKKIVEKIRDADLTISDEVRKQQLLRSMSRPVSPSETAAKIVPKPKSKSGWFSGWFS